MSGPLDAARAAWIHGPVSILVATSNAEREPGLGIGLGVRISDDYGMVRVFVLDTVSRRVIDDVRAGSAIAVVFTHSLTARALQLKASGASVVVPSPEDTRYLDEHAERLSRDWEGVGGRPKGFARAFLVRAPGSLVALDVVPETAYEQTPGPNAGTKL